jgi:TPR repeat protein
LGAVRFSKCAKIPGCAAWLMAALGSCTASQSYMGIGLAPGAAPTEIQSLARQAGAGDKRAQWQLGIAFEEGRGLPRSCTAARRLYRLAAAASGGASLAYLPAAGKGGRGMVVPSYSGPLVAGLAEAQQRLITLRRNAGHCPVRQGAQVRLEPQDAVPAK